MSILKFENYLDFLREGGINEDTIKELIKTSIDKEGITYADDSLEFQRGLLIGLRTGCTVMKMAATNLENLENNKEKEQ